MRPTTLTLACPCALESHHPTWSQVILKEVYYCLSLVREQNNHRMETPTWGMDKWMCSSFTLERRNRLLFSFPLAVICLFFFKHINGLPRAHLWQRFCIVSSFIANGKGFHCTLFASCFPDVFSKAHWVVQWIIQVKLEFASSK